jgi:hypothetical protein
MTVVHFWFNCLVFEAETLASADSSEVSRKAAMDTTSEGWTALLRCTTLCSRAEFIR